MTLFGFDFNDTNFTPTPPEEVCGKIYQIKLRIPIPNYNELNVYYVEDEFPALIDTGPGYGLGEVILRKIKKLGFDPAKLRYAVNTHEHPEHLGGNLEIKAGSGAVIAAHPLTEEGVRTANYKPPGDFLAMLGDAMQEIYEKYKNQFEEIADLGVEFYLEEGGVLDLGARKFRVIHTPGHSPGHICLLEESEGILLSGDHIVGVGTPYIGGVERIAIGKGKKQPPAGDLADYLRSLEKLQRLDIRRILPAHGPVCGKERIQESIDGKLSREKRLLDILKRRERGTLAELTAELYDADEASARLLKGSTLAYLKKLIDEEVVREIREDDGSNFILLKDRMP
ncbi:MAG: MBL fold metallo-hydrolase [bacterium]